MIVPSTPQIDPVLTLNRRLRDLTTRPEPATQHELEGVLLRHRAENEPKWPRNPRRHR